MKKVLHVLFTFICAANLLTSCTGKEGEPGPSLKGNIVGFVNPIDDNGAVSSDKAGITVTLENTSPKMTATTNADGKFEFQNVSTGTYNVLYTRTSYGTMRRFGFAHVGGTEPTFLGTQGLPQVSKTVVNSFNYTTSSSYYYDLNFSYTISNANVSTGSYYRMAIYVGTSPNVSSETGTLLSVYSVSGTSGSVGFTKSTFTSLGYTPGTKLYVIAYGVPYSLYSYTDVTTGRPVYVGLNASPSPVSGFTL
jgi:hypothetical protein